MKGSRYIVLAASLLLMTCTGKDRVHENITEVTEPSKDKYACPMHPEVVRHAPGKCPVCGMDLVILKGGAANDIMLNANQVLLANIKTQKALVQSIGQTVVISGKVAVDQQYTQVISSRAAGRVEKIFFKEIGRTVKKGERLYELYSETLIALQNEYLLAREQYESLGTTEGRYKSFLKATEKKLLLYGFSNEQITRLEKTRLPMQRVEFVAPESGIITAVNVSEGQYVSEGATLYSIENISKLWLEAELYPQETSLVSVGDNVTARISGYESVPVEAKVTFLSPEYRTNTQITVLRAALKNPRLTYKPGMQAQVLFSHSGRKTLAIPVDAVIRDGNGTHVYVESGKNTFQPRVVMTGLEDFENVEITAGLSENETVVVSGAYLLYSELVLRRGVNPMAEQIKKHH